VKGSAPDSVEFSPHNRFMQFTPARCWHRVTQLLCMLMHKHSTSRRFRLLAAFFFQPIEDLSDPSTTDSKKSGQGSTAFNLARVQQGLVVVRQLHAIWTWATSLPFGLWPLWDRIPGE